MKLENAVTVSDSYRQMTSGTLGEREEKYLRDAAQSLVTPPGESVPVRLIIQKAFMSAIQESTGLKQKNWNIDADSLQFFIGVTVEPLLLKVDSWKPQDVVPLLLALQTINLMDQNVLEEILSRRVPSLLKMSGQLLVKGFHSAAWEIRTFLATHFSAALKAPLNMLLSQAEDADRPGMDKTTLAEYVDAVVHDMDEAAKLECLKDFLVREAVDFRDGPLRLFVANRLIRNIKGTCSPTLPL